jgi:hypothetical protein
MPCSSFNTITCTDVVARIKIQSARDKGKTSRTDTGRLGNYLSDRIDRHAALAQGGGNYDWQGSQRSENDSRV